MQLADSKILLAKFWLHGLMRFFKKERLSKSNIKGQVYSRRQCANVTSFVLKNIPNLQFNMWPVNRLQSKFKKGKFCCLFGVNPSPLGCWFFLSNINSGPNFPLVIFGPELIFTSKKPEGHSWTPPLLKSQWNLHSKQSLNFEGMP